VSKKTRVSKVPKTSSTRQQVKVRSSKSVVARTATPAKLSFGQIAGLHSAADPLSLKSSVALVIDQDTQEVLFSKNDHAVLPIASLTKIMTGPWMKY
jgi:D-alanyl-D-alanine endopeptidase (penicillin-binding protein 7)